MEKCPCGSGKLYDECCQPVIQGTRDADTAESLMRARYSAFVKTDIDFLYNTVSTDQQKDFNYKEATDWSRNSEWRGLEILETIEGGPDDEAIARRCGQKSRVLFRHGRKRRASAYEPVTLNRLLFHGRR